MFLTSAASIHQLYSFKFAFFYKGNQYLLNLIKKGMLKNANILRYALHRCQLTWNVDLVPSAVTAYGDHDGQSSLPMG